MNTEDDTAVPSPPDTSNSDTGLDPGRVETEHPPDAAIPGQALFNEVVGKIVGGTVIPSATDLPAPNATRTTDDHKPVPDQPLPPAPTTHQNDKRDSTSSRSSEDTPSAKPKTTVKDKLQELKNKTVGAYPITTQIGWLEAYKRIDGPQNEYRDKNIWMEEFASSALFGAFWHNAAAVMVIPVVCFIVFKLGGGFISMVLIIAFGATYYKNSVRRFRRNARDDITRELIRNTIEDQVESTEWLNNFLSKFWVIYEPVLSATIVQIVDSILVDSTPSFLDSLRLTEFTLGTKAPRVESIKTYPKSESDLVMMDWRVSFAPTDIEDMTPRQLRTQINPKIVLTVRVGKGIVGAGMPILVEDMSFSGNMRIRLKLTSNFPHIKIFDFSFLEQPTIDYVLKPVGGDTFGMDIAHIPGLQSFIRDQTHAILGPMMYAPNVYAMDLEQMMTGGASLTAAIGIVQFTIYDAKDLKNAELIGNSDPYVKLRLGNRPELATTTVKENTLNPVWNETNIILINNLNEVVCMEIFDRDNLRKDRPLGQATFDLKCLQEDPIQDDVNCKVFRNGKQRGSIRIRAAYFPVQKPEVAEDGSVDEPVASNSGILAVNLAQAKDIARTGKTKSHCDVSLNGKVVHSTKRVIGANPAWASDLDLFITDLENAHIHVDVIAEGKVLGSYGTSATSLLKDTQNKVDWVTLKGGDGAAKLKMTGVWKPIIMGEDLNPSEHKPAIGVARVRVFAGRNLRNVEIGSSSDPYVTISGNKGIVLGRTKTINNNLNPSWNEIHYVPVNSIKQAIDFTVFDYEKIKKDRNLGRARFDISEIVEEQHDILGYTAKAAVDRWVPLVQKDGSEKGELHFEASFYPSLRLAYEATEKESKAPVEALKISDPAEATETVAFPEGETLKAQATTLPSGTIPASEALSYESGILVTTLIGGEVNESGTYCELYVDSDYPQYKSQRQRSKSPKWNEVADIFVKELEYAKLIIAVRETSSMEKDPVVGTFTGNVRQLLETTPREGGLFDIFDKNDKHGALRLKFEFLPVHISLLPRERLDNMGNLTISLVRAKDLVAADRGGTSDPYVVFRINGKDIFKSEAVKKSLNPEYNESFMVPITSRVEDQVSLEVFDWNQLGSAKSLGAATLDLSNLQLVLPNEFLIPLKNKQNQGQVQLRMKFMPEFLSSHKRKSGFGSTFVGAAGAVGSGGQAIGRGVITGVGAVGHGAIGVTGAIEKGAVKGVGAMGKSFMGGISAGASAIGLHKKDSSADSQPSTNAPNLEGLTSGHVASSSSDVGEPGNLTVRIIEADSLMGVDKSGTSDPYVKVYVGEQNVLKTKVKKETLTPVWNESVLVPLTGDAFSLSLVVKDHNTIGSDKDLGTYDLSVWDYILPGSDEHPGQYHADFWVPLSDGRGGRLHLALEFEPAPDGTESMKSGSRSKRLFSRK